MYSLYRSCGHELIDPEITITKLGVVINGSCACRLVNLIELSIAYTDEIFNSFKVVCSSGKFDLSEPIIYQHLNAMYWKSSRMPEQSELEDYPEYDLRKRNCINALDPIRNSTNEAEGRWVPGPLQLVAYIRTITSALALAKKYLIEYNNSVPFRTFVRTGGLSINSPLETAYHCHFSLIGLHSMVFVMRAHPSLGSFTDCGTIPASISTREHTDVCDSTSECSWHSAPTRTLPLQRGASNVSATARDVRVSESRTLED